MEFYSVQLREKIEVPDTDVEITVAENGRRQARATVQKEGKAIKLFQVPAQRGRGAGGRNDRDGGGDGGEGDNQAERKSQGVT